MEDGNLVAGALVMILQFGINMLVPILLCTMAGVWIGNRIGINWIAIPMFFIGALAGGNNIYRMAKKLIDPDPYGIARRKKDADRGKH